MAEPAGMDMSRERRYRYCRIVCATIVERPLPGYRTKKSLSFKGFGKKADVGSKDVRPETVIPLDARDLKNF